MMTASALFFFSQACFVVVSLYMQVMLKNLRYSYSLIGFGMALMELLGMIGPVLVGAFVDRHGHMRKVLGVLMVALCGSVLLIVRLPLYAIPLFACGLAGFCNKSQLSLQDALGMDVAHGDVDKYSRMRAMGTLGAVFFSFLYGLTRLPDVSDNRSILHLILISSVPYLVLCFFPHHGRKGMPQARPVVRAKGERWCDRSFVLCLVLVAMGRLAMAGVQYMPLYMVDVLGDDRIMLMYTCATMSEFAAMLLAGRLINQRVLSPLACMVISSLAVALRMLLYAMVPSVLGVALAQCTHSFCFGFFQPAIVLFVRQLVSPTDQAKGMGFMQSVGTGLMTMVGNLCCGFLVDLYGYRGMFLSCGAVALASALLFWGFRRRFSTT
ncbi:MAG: MFS transporter [Sphaerochaetaceae bacterium]|nr:MFS transporter [Spirochaetales bacterium]MDY5498654.1 MFS transporter [Sphaerochaetaceae bacterium]